MLVGVVMAPATPETGGGRPRRAGPAGRHRRGRRGGPGGPAAGPARPGDLRRPGQGRGAGASLSVPVDADTVVFDDELTPAQQRNLEKILGRTAIDRTAVILDIFAQNARSPEGKAQVELALLRYRLPRLRGRGLGLSQQAGGIGTRGPGETQLEVDRRRLVRRMHRLEADLREVDRTRQVQRKSRAAGPPARAGPGRLHQRRQVDAAQPADRRRRAGRGPAVRHPRPPDPPAGPARRRDGAGDRHRRLRAQAAPPAGGGVPLDPRARCSWPTCWSTWSTASAPTPRARSTRCARCWTRSGRPRSPSCWWSTRRDLSAREAARLAAGLRRGGGRLGRRPARASTSCVRTVADRLRVGDRVVEPS